MLLTLTRKEEVAFLYGIRPRSLLRQHLMTGNSPRTAIYQILGGLALIVGIYLFFRQGFNLALAFFLALIITIWAKWLV